MIFMPLSSSSQNGGRTLNYNRVIAAVLVAVLAVGVLGYAVFGRRSNYYQAIFLTNGQVYFGKVVSRGWKTIDIRDVYYLQVKNIPTSSVSSDDLSLIKLGNELHGPQDGLEINWQQVLFIETLRSDSRVVGAIEKYHSR